ncbi:M48 family metalloprotease [Legionella sp. CNM-4043-24]|uniref:M48 family metalloprotease n=1 Tax=Legionella sp. CNM-4043-24 TaxID=3421646 RepID=UPI00403AF578
MLPILKKIPFLLLTLLLQLGSFSAWSLTPFSNNELDELEKEFVQLINQSDSIDRDPLANQYINQLGRQLAEAARIPSSRFFIVKSNEINAFAGPGGYIGVNTQLILASENESELAGVMAHELAHVRLHHLYRMIEHQKQMRVPMLASVLASVALSAVNPVLANGALMASLTGFAQDNINFTRANEKEADRIGIDMLIRSGQNPAGMAAFFKKMQQHSRYYYTENIPAILRTHPMDDDRIAEAEERTTSLAKKSYADNLDYRLFKELIRTDTVSDNKQLLEYYQLHCQKPGAGVSCQYGYALTELNLNRYAQAEARLATLIAGDSSNLFYQLAMARARIGHREFDSAITQMRELQSNYPENYAVLMTYGDSLLAAGKTAQAASVFLKGSRKFKNDLPLCEALARAESAANRKAYAYFTQARCHLLQGRKRDAVRQLKMVKTMARNDPYLLARTEAMMDEVKRSID